MTDHSWSEHQKLEQVLTGSPHPWILTYDADDRTRELYRDFRCLRFGISHTAQVQKVGREFMFFSRGLRVGLCSKRCFRPDALNVRSAGKVP